MELLKKLENLSVEDDCVWGGDDGLKLVARFFDIEPNRCAIFFAAAPEMYEALKECIQWIEQQNIPEYKIGPRIAEYKKLLAKAEGREV